MPAAVLHLAAHNYRFVFKDPNVKVRYEDASRFFSGAEPRAKVQALIKIEGQGWLPVAEDWTGLPEREFCRTTPGELEL
jgi:hypothetical protein